jgi:hypothetical protein
MYVSLLFYTKLLYTVTLMMIMMLQDRNTYFALCKCTVYNVPQYFQTLIVFLFLFLQQ